MRQLLAAFFAVCAAYSQTDAVLTGTILDSSEAAVAGAKVRATHGATGVVSAAVSNESGVYRFPALPPGTYRVEAEAAGFRPVRYDAVALEIGARISLNLKLEVGLLTEVVSVNASSETALGYESASVGNVVSGQKVLDLPLPARNALSLTFINAGVMGDNFGGSRIGALNITVDGINVQDNRINSGVSSPIFTSVDRIEEFRVVTSPADAELGRGSGQIIMTSRSGGNQFRGSLFEFHRNTVLNANTFFNNQRGNDPATGAPISPRNNLIRNQFGGRVGGPIRRNRTFFHFLYDGQRIRTRNAVTSTVYTETARRGIFRYFQGVQNGNAFAARPTVDLLGNPVRPAGAGELQSFVVFGRDPARPGPDPTGLVQRYLNDLTPLPNNFRVGDGLNTAGYTWSRSGSEDFNNFNFKIDHNFNSSHRLSYAYSWERGRDVNGTMPQVFPKSPGGRVDSEDRFHTLQVTSTLTPSLLNEFRAGAVRPRRRSNAPWETAGTGTLGQAGGQPFGLDMLTITDPVNLENDPQGRITPTYLISNNATWLRGKHAFKGGFEMRFVSSNGFNSFDVMPRVAIGAGGAPVQGINTLPGVGANLALGQNLLSNLAGSVTTVTQAFNSVGVKDPVYIPGEFKQRTWKTPELSWFFKDDWKVTPNLSLNLGVRYEWYGVPYDANGRTAGLVGGSAGVFGISGTSMADLFQPGAARGSLTRVELVGPNSPNPSRQLYADDYNNFAPAVGFTWSLPWFGKNKTVFRAGYGIAYERNAIRLADVVSGDQPGLREATVFRSANYLNLASVRLPLTTVARPLETVPLTDRNQIVRAYDSGLRTPYVQNWNASIQRRITPNTVLDVRYVGSKGTRLPRTVSINEQNIFETGILDAFRITQQGGHSELLNRVFQGLNVTGVGVVDGVRITGSDAVRGNTTTQAYLIANGAGTLADYLNNSLQFTNVRGGFLRRAGLPENYVVANPQFASARMVGNFANSTWHSLQVEVIKRFSKGWTFQGNYTWSRTLGEEEGDGQELVDSYRTLRNRRIEKRLLAFHRTHIFRNNGTWELPVNVRVPVLAQIANGWRVSPIVNIFSGAPFGLLADLNTVNTLGDNTPSVVGAFPKSAGTLRRTGNGVVYFDGLGQAPDPSIAGMTTANNIRGLSRLLAVTDAAGNVLLRNPLPGEIGNLQSNYLEGPGSIRFDLNLTKRFKIDDRFNVEVRADIINASNSPDFDNPNADINSVNFGRITGAGGNRIVVLGARFNF